MPKRQATTNLLLKGVTILSFIASLDPIFQLTTNYLRELAKQELLLETSNTKSTPIGFVSKNNQ